MSFLSIRYLCFLCILFFFYFLLGTRKKEYRWMVLLVASLVFYGFYSVKYSLFLLFSIVVTWGASIGIQRCNQLEKTELLSLSSITKEQKKKIRSSYEKRKKLWVFLAILFNVGLLVVMKYLNFSIGVLHVLTGWNIAPLGWIVLPLGFSFYTFQSLGYCIDVYRGTVEAQPNILKYALFVSFFPQLSEGPIGNYEELFPQLMEGKPFEYDRFVKGLIRMLIGFFKKVVIADRLARFISPVYENYHDYSGIVLFLATILYSFQLYADFSGYSDIALGTGECLGIHMMENFETPYFSSSITEFWRRWHISLGVWFRNYLYYPILRSEALTRLGKNLSKSGKKKLASSLTATVGLLVTWTVIGMWHGAGYKYLAYGWYHGFFIILAVWMSDGYKKAKAFFHIQDNLPWKIFQIARTFFLVTIGYVIFRAGRLNIAVGIYKRMLSAFYYKGALSGLSVLSRGGWIVLLFGVAACVLFDVIERKEKLSEWICSRNIVVRWILLYGILALTVVCFLVRSADASNFIYFNF